MNSSSPLLSPAGEGRAGRHVTLGTTRIFDGSLEAALELCQQTMEAGAGGTVATANLDFLALARRDAQLREDLERSWLVVADGAPVAWLARLRGGRRTRRIAGVDLVEGLLRQAERMGGLRLGLYGSTPEIAARAIAVIAERYPSVEVVAAVHPPFRPLAPGEEDDYLLTMVSARPDVCLIALGCPRQERVIAQYYDRLPSAIWIGVGGTLDFFAGERVRAPRWAQVVGLEWTVRLVQDPRRLWRRYLLRDVPELAALTLSVARGRPRPARRGL